MGLELLSMEIEYLEYLHFQFFAIGLDTPSTEKADLVNQQTNIKSLTSGKDGNGLGRMGGRRLHPDYRKSTRRRLQAATGKCGKDAYA